MTIDRLAPPPFEAAVRQLVDLALEFPENSTPHAYTALTPAGVRRPYDLIAHAYVLQGGSIEAFAGRRDDSYLPNPTEKNLLRLPIVWDYLYTQPAIFLGLRDDEQKAQDLLVYWLYHRVQRATDQAPWKPAMVRALRSLRRLILHPNSGFLVQTHGNHVELRDRAVVVITDELARLVG